MRKRVFRDIIVIRLLIRAKNDVPRMIRTRQPDAAIPGDIGADFRGISQQILLPYGYVIDLVFLGPPRPDGADPLFETVIDVVGYLLAQHARHHIPAIPVDVDHLGIGEMRLDFPHVKHVVRPFVAPFPARLVAINRVKRSGEAKLRLLARKLHSIIPVLQPFRVFNFQMLVVQPVGK